MAKLLNFDTFSKPLIMKTKRKIGLYATRYADLAIALLSAGACLAIGIYLILNSQIFI